MCNLNEQLKETQDDATLEYCVSFEKVSTEFLNVPHPTLVCFLEEELLFVYSKGKEDYK